MPELMPPPLALYIHIPWCVKKCPYCDFNSHGQKSELPVADYIAALTRDLEQDLPLVWGRTISSVFFGGGTPAEYGVMGIGGGFWMLASAITIHIRGQLRDA